MPSAMQRQPGQLNQDKSQWEKGCGAPPRLGPGHISGQQQFAAPPVPPKPLVAEQPIVASGAFRPESGPPAQRRPPAPAGLPLEPNITGIGVKMCVLFSLPSILHFINNNLFFFSVKSTVISFGLILSICLCISTFLL